MSLATLHVRDRHDPRVFQSARFSQASIVRGRPSACCPTGSTLSVGYPATAIPVGGRSHAKAWASVGNVALGRPGTVEAPRRFVGGRKLRRFGAVAARNEGG